MVYEVCSSLGCAFRGLVEHGLAYLALDFEREMWNMAYDW